MRVDPHGSRADTPSELVCNAEIASPDTRGEAVIGVVRFLCDPIQIVVIERYRTDHRAEDLVAHHRHLWSRVGQHRRRDEIACIAYALATGDDTGALLPTGVKEAGDTRELLFRHQRSHLR